MEKEDKIIDENNINKSLNSENNKKFEENEIEQINTNEKEDEKKEENNNK